MSKRPCEKHKRYFHVCGACKKVNAPETATPKVVRVKEGLGFTPCRRDTKCEVCY